MHSLVLRPCIPLLKMTWWPQAEATGRGHCVDAMQAGLDSYAGGQPCGYTGHTHARANSMLPEPSRDRYRG